MSFFTIIIAKERFSGWTDLKQRITLSYSFSLIEILDTSPE